MNSAIDHRVSFEADIGVIRISVSGPMDNSSARSIISEAMNLGTEKGCTRFFYDLRDARLSMTTIELYFLPRAFDYEKDHKCAALIQQNDESESWHFLETVERNLGIDMRVFIDESKAIDWLTTRSVTTGSREAG